VSRSTDGAGAALWLAIEIVAWSAALLAYIWLGERNATIAFVVAGVLGIGAACVHAVRWKKASQNHK
jgi:hypothetical protein